MWLSAGLCRAFRLEVESLLTFVALREPRRFARGGILLRVQRHIYLTILPVVRGSTGKYSIPG